MNAYIIHICIQIYIIYIYVCTYVSSASAHTHTKATKQPSTFPRKLPYISHLKISSLHQLSFLPAARRSIRCICLPVKSLQYCTDNNLKSRP